jgi:hypothetical protein
MAGTSRKHTAVLHDEEVADLLQSKSKQSLSDSGLDTENELEDRALLDTVIIEGSDKDDDPRQDFVWENVENANKKFHGQCWTSRCCKTCYENCGHF